MKGNLILDRLNSLPVISSSTRVRQFIVFGWMALATMPSLISGTNIAPIETIEKSHAELVCGCYIRIDSARILIRQ
jgi:hypothetical protein